MDPDLVRKLLINMVILAQADGAVDPLEREFVQKFLKAARVSNTLANAWMTDAAAAGWTFQPVAERQPVLDLLKLMVGVAAADGRLEKKEGDLLIQMAKVCDIPREDVAAMVKENWGRDVLADIITRLSAKPSEPKAELTVALVTDNFASAENVVAGNPSLQFTRHALAEVLGDGVPSPVIVLHACENRQDSLNAVDALKKRNPGAKIIVVVRRDQAFQIRYLMEQGIHRCLVEPIFPNELRQVLGE